MSFGDFLRCAQCVSCWKYDGKALHTHTTAGSRETVVAETVVCVCVCVCVHRTAIYSAGQSVQFLLHTEKRSLEVRRPLKHEN